MTGAFPGCEGAGVALGLAGCRGGAVESGGSAARLASDSGAAKVTSLPGAALVRAAKTAEGWIRGGVAALVRAAKMAEGWTGGGVG